MTKEITGTGILETGIAGSKITEAKILGNTEIANRIYRMILACGRETAGAKSGQFINVYLRDKSMLLPRPVSICLAEGEQLTLVYRVVGKGTQALSEYRAGEFLKISTPMGHGYDVDDVFWALDHAEETEPGQKTVALVAGGLGVPPMVELAKTIRSRITGGWSQGKDADGQGLTAGGRDSRIRLVSVVGFQEVPFLIEDLEAFCDEVSIATENGSAGFQGNVLEMMETKGIEADYYLSCGPKPMLKTLSELCGRVKKPLQVSLEERMGCGYGACVGCTCKTKETHGDTEEVRLKKVCKDGPVFFGNEVIWNE